jgi:dihydropyrimidinase
MEELDLIIKGGLVVSGKGMVRADVGVCRGKVACLSPDIEDDAATIIDASGKYVLPGAIDVHVHPVYLDDMGAASVTAAFGGVTTMIHFGYVRPGMEFIPTLQAFREEGLAKSALDFGLHAGMFEVKNQLPYLAQAFEMGITSYKVFMTYAKLKWMTDDYHLLALMEAVSARHGLVMVHCENGLATDYLEDKFREQGRPPKEVFMDTRPGLLEAEATYRSMCMAQVAGCPIYVVHVSAAPALGHIRRAKADGWRVWAETCPQYLALTDRATQALGALAKIGPPLRTPADVDALWGALGDGTLDIIGSDHAPKDKRLEDDFFEAPYGSPQTETMLTIVHDQGVNAGRITLPRLARVMAENPARAFGLYPRKGVLEPGSDADVVLFDPQLRKILTHAGQHSNASYTLYEGREVLGAPVLTMQRGRVIVEDGEFKGEHGAGCYLPTSMEHLYTTSN